MKIKIILLIIALSGCNAEGDLTETIDSNEQYSRIAFVGNSITEHEISKKIGWNCKCGMAASSKENDFDYLVSNYFGASQHIVNIAMWEQDFDNERFESFLDLYVFQPDLIIINLGENITEINIKNVDLVYELETLHFELTGNTAARIIYVDSFLTSVKINALFDEFAVKNNVELVKISNLNIDENKATNHENSAVASHPNDSGHYEIYQRIISTIESNKATN